MNPFDPLANLPDITLPQETIGWWPLAWGWWVIIVSTVLMTVSIFIWRRHQRLQNRWRVEALVICNHLYDDYREHKDPHRYAVDITRLMKRIIKIRLSRHSTQPLEGEHWTDFLLRHSKPGRFDRTTLEQLQQSLYAPEPTLDIEPFHLQCVAWIEELR